MVQVQVDLSKEEDEILEAHKYISGKNDKKLALKDLIIEYAKLSSKIREAIQVKKKVK